MTELERRLLALGAELDVPPAPEVAATVAPRIARRRRGRRRILVAVAVAAAGLAVALAVPPARSAILRFFHLRGVTVERVQTLPPGRERTLAQSLGPSVPLPEAERRVGFRMLLPPGAHPDRARVLRGLATVVLERNGAPLVLSEFRAQGFDVLKKVAAPATLIEPVHVGHDLGLWVAGPEHVVFFVTGTGSYDAVPIRVRGNVLLWQHDELTLRLQGRLTRADAIAIARSLR